MAGMEHCPPKSVEQFADNARPERTSRVAARGRVAVIAVGSAELLHRALAYVIKKCRPGVSPPRRAPAAGLMIYWLAQLALGQIVAAQASIALIVPALTP
jgi:hypothetical protein